MKKKKTTYSKEEVNELFGIDKIECRYADECSDYKTEKCKNCKKNVKRKRSHYEPDEPTNPFEKWKPYKPPYIWVKKDDPKNPITIRLDTPCLYEQIAKEYTEHGESPPPMMLHCPCPKCNPRC